MLKRLVASAIVLWTPQAGQQLPRPGFETHVDIVLVDAHVVDRNGKPIADLRPDEFEVEISGRRRRVASVQFVSYGGPPAAAAPGTPTAASEPSPVRPRRMFIVAVDEHSLHISNAMAAVNAAERFIDRLQPDDLVGLHAYPTGAATHDLTSDHASVRRALQKIGGLYSEPASRLNLSPTEAIDIASGDREAQLAVFRRECASGGCSQNDIRNEAISFAGSIEMRVSQSVGGLRGLVRGLEQIPGRKTLVLVSGGLITTDRGSGRANASAEIAALGREVAQANLSVFALHLDWSFLEAVSARSGLRLSYFRDSNMAATGLEMVAGAGGGAVFRVQGTSPDLAFDRVLHETSAHYLLGVEGSEADRDGRAHPIRVRVKRRGAHVRSRTSVVVPRRDGMDGGDGVDGGDGGDGGSQTEERSERRTNGGTEALT
jgi:VWFA-related protein